MSLTLIGLSHHTAPLAIREEFAAQVQAGQHSLAQVVASGHVREAVLLSTCNRTELYVDGDDGLEDAALIALLPSAPGIPQENIAQYVYVQRGSAVAEHLLRVVSSLDSMILGEPQIQGQVRSAYESARKLQGEQKVVGPVLSRLFEIALRVGSRVRSETQLGVGAASIPSAAVELARKIFGSLKGRRALILGTGEMSEIAFECLADEGAHTTVVSRTPERARELAGRRSGDAVAIHEFAPLLPQADIVVTATAAPHPVITRELVERVLPRGAPEPLLIVDIALPRDVDADVGELPNIFLYNLDDLHQVIEGNLQKRRSELPVAEAIIAQGATEFANWYRSLEVVPLIRELRERAEQTRVQELAKAMRTLRHLSDDDRAVIELLTRQLTAKLLHHPTVRLRDAASQAEAPHIVDAARYLFEMNEGDQENNGK